MCTRDQIASRCVLLKSVPDTVDEGSIRHSVKGTLRVSQYNELGALEIRWIVQLQTSEDANGIIRNRKLELRLSDGGIIEVPVGGCPECIIPDEWVESGENSSLQNQERVPSPVYCHFTLNHDQTTSGTPVKTGDGFQDPENADPQVSSRSRDMDSPDTPESSDVFDWSAFSKSSKVEEKMSSRQSDSLYPQMEHQSVRSWTSDSAPEVWNSASSDPSQDKGPKLTIKISEPDNYENVSHLANHKKMGSSSNPSPSEEAYNLGSSNTDRTIYQNVDLVNVYNDPNSKMGDIQPQQNMESVNPDLPPPVPKRLPVQKPLTLSTTSTPPSKRGDSLSERPSHPDFDLRKESVPDKANSSNNSATAPSAPPLEQTHIDRDTHRQHEGKVQVAGLPHHSIPENQAEQKHAEAMGYNFGGQGQWDFPRFPFLPPPGQQQMMPYPFFPVPGMQPPVYPVPPEYQPPTTPTPPYQVPPGQWPQYQVLPGTPLLQVSPMPPGLPNAGVDSPRGSLSAPPPYSGQGETTGVPPVHRPPESRGTDPGAEAQTARPGADADNSEAGTKGPGVAINGANAKTEGKETRKKAAGKDSPRKSKKKGEQAKKESMDSDKPADCQHIRVTWEGTVSKETLECFFENKRKSGGEDIEEIDFDEDCCEAVIKFESPIAHRVIEKGTSHKVYKAHLEISLFDPEKEAIWEERSLLVSGISLTTTEDCLDSYLETRSNATPQSFLYGEEGEGKVLVTFEEAPDFEKLSSACKKKPLEGKYLTVSRVKRCCAVCVSGIENITEDTLELFFENTRRSGGGPVRKLDVQHDVGICIVYFKKPEVAERVYTHNSSPVLSGLHLTVKPYYPCLGLPREMAKMSVDPSQPFCVTMENIPTYVIRFLRNSKPIRSTFDEELKKHDAKVDWKGVHDKSTDVVIQSTHAPGTKVTKVKLKWWKTEARKAAESFLDQLKFEELSAAKEAWKEITNYLKTVNIQDPEKVGVVLEKEQSCVIVVGYIENVKRLTKDIKENITKCEEKIAAQKSHVSKEKTLPSHQLHMLHKLQFVKSAKSSFSNLEVEVKIKDKMVCFTGPLQEVNKAMVKMHETLESLVTKSLDISEQMKELFEKTETKDMLNQEWKRKRIQSAWRVTDNSHSIEIFAVNKSELDQAVEVFQDVCREEKFVIRENIREFLRREEWINLVKKMKSRYEGKLALGSIDKCVTVAATKDVIHTIAEEVQQEVHVFNTKFCTGAELLEANRGRIKYVENYLKREVSDIEKKYENITISAMYEGKAGFEILGDKSAVKKAKEELRDMIKTIKEEKHKMTQPGCRDFFSSKEGEEAVKKTERTHMCVIKNTAEKHEARDSEKGSDDQRPVFRPRPPVERASCSEESAGHPYKVIVMEGDMTMLKVDAIVNAANGDLDHCGGLAKAISDSGGPSIQSKSSDYVKKHGPLKDGEAIYTDPGKLPCRYVIHAVGPRWDGGHRGEESDLRKAVSNSLQIAKEKGLKSVAFPALSAGIFGYPVDAATQVIIETIRYFFMSKEGKESSLSEIYLCGVDRSIILSFIKSLQKHYRGVTVNGNMSPERESVEESTQPRQRKREERSPSEHDRDRKTRGRSGIEITIVKGELAEQKVDVIINSAHHSLDLSIGAISKSLLKAGGDVLQSECQTKYAKGIKPGNVAMTKSGDLRCSQVYHGTLQKWDGLKGSALQSLESFVSECLRLANMNNLRSLAFPALGTGQLGYPADLVASTMFKCIRKFEQEHSDTSIQEVFLVLYHKDHATIKAFEQISQSGPSAGAETQEGRGHRRGHQRQGSKKSTKLGKLDVQIVQGNITEEKSDAIVNSSGERLDLSKGVLSKAILRAAGPKLQEECYDQVQTMKRNGLVVTSGGNMQCKYIIHVKAQRDKESWKHVVMDALDAADKKKCKCLSFPALGTGGQGCSPEDVAKAMFKAIHKFSSRSLEQVRVVVFKEDMVENFTEALRSASESMSTKVSKKTKGNDEEAHDSADRPEKPKTEDLVFILWSQSSDGLKRAKQELDDVIKRECSEEKIKENETIKKLNEKQIRHLVSIGRKYDVTVHIVPKAGSLVLQGRELSVIKARGDILQVLGDIERNVNVEKNAETLAKYVNWQFNDGEKWRKVNPYMNLQIEEAYRNKIQKLTVKDRSGVEYVVDLQKNEEYEKKTPSKVYKIQRSEVGSRGANTIGLPSTWEKPSQGVQEVPLNPGCREYKKVLEEFTKSGGPSSIQKMYRVQNPSLYHQYAAKRKDIQGRNNGKNPERWLWHGTSANTITHIINNGFNRSYCGKNGTAYGNGVYFAVNSSYSVGYCSADSQGHKHIFAAQVLVGESCQGHGGMTVLPQKSGGKAYETYDSATDRPGASNMYIIFHDSQAYPTYHIVFS